MRSFVKTTLVRGGAIRSRSWLRESSTGHFSERERLPLVLLHGFTGNHRSWEPLVRQILAPELESIHRIVAPDLPGHGGSRIDRARLSMETASRALEDALDALEIRRCLLHGYSMGGRFALYFALTRPRRVARLSLEGASPGLPTEGQRSQRRISDAELAGSLARNGLGAFVDRWESLPLFATQRLLPPALRDQQRRIRMSNDAYGLAASLRGMGAGSQPWLGRRLRELRLPVLLVAGGKDNKFSITAREMHARIPRSRLQIIPDAGHAVHIERSGELARRLDDFLSIQIDAPPQPAEPRQPRAKS